MSASAQATPNVANLDRQLNEQITKGDILAAFDQFYAEDVSMQENSEPPFVGKAANRKREEEFVTSVQEIHSVKLLSSAVNGDVSFSEWEFDATYKGGTRIKLSEVAVRRWKNGQVAQERFYYSKG
ncbi:MAG TPA: nuclear transport factor 2 family protein [Bryobacteraceae bacterium]